MLGIWALPSKLSTVWSPHLCLSFDVTMALPVPEPRNSALNVCLSFEMLPAQIVSCQETCPNGEVSGLCRRFRLLLNRGYGME